jgi:hypothetical protein
MALSGSRVCNAAKRDEFYDLLDRSPRSPSEWDERQARLRLWRADVRFEAYWASIDEMLTDTFPEYQRRSAVFQTAIASASALEDYDFDAWRRQREYDRQHAADHLP